MRDDRHNHDQNDAYGQAIEWLREAQIHARTGDRESEEVALDEAIKAGVWAHGLGEPEPENLLKRLTEWLKGCWCIHVAASTINYMIARSEEVPEGFAKGKR